ncbi:dihydrolipoamide acetyltransferase family protein, partial [Phytoactinopolyspora endophytica]|uniref:dihydrolipoamide acetyltransferase family protein n=1 Tax=Phytoactinopolyspora endophytica TaxID=1642495 RepID=UPI00197B4124
PAGDGGGQGEATTPGPESGQGGDSPARPTAPGPEASADPTADAAEDGETTPVRPEEEARQPVLVGYGPRTASAKRRPRKPIAVPAAGAVGADRTTEGTAEGNGSTDAPRARVLAKPPVRKLAKDLGVDISTVTPTGPHGTVTRDDVQATASATTAAPTADSTAGLATAPPDAGAPSAPTTPAHVPTGLGWHGQPREERVAIRSVRRKTAAAMVQSAFTAPHVTEFVTVDVSRTMKLADRLRQSREFRDVKLTPLALVARALCIAVPRTPEVNTRWDDDAGEIVVQRYVNLGIAAATPRGLVVPNIKDAHEMSLRDLAQSINQLASTARDGKTPPADMLRGTISITNVGVFGVDTGTPILNPGEAAILAFGTVRRQPWVHKGKVKPRWVTTLALSFDHRLVDGEQGSRFLADIASMLEDPGNALAWS